MKIEKFEDILSWQRSQDLAVAIYDIFSKNKDFSFKNQIERAVISIGNNIAEGYERKSNKEFTQFLYIAKGSCGEVRSMLYIALKLKYISAEEFETLANSSKEISKLLSGLIKKL
ncbi:MAG: four helix bundle protein [Candidatus Paceibacterota bacterium]|jgi:four helix bundle protein